MQKYLLNMLIVSFIALGVGCQSNKMGGNTTLFGNPFNNANSAPQMGLAESVQEAFMRHDELAVAPIHIEARQNVVILSGYVKKIRQSDTAEQIARQVPGVQSVENRLIVRQ